MPDNIWIIKHHMAQSVCLLKEKMKFRDTGPKVGQPSIQFVHMC